MPNKKTFKKLIINWRIEITSLFAVLSCLSLFFAFRHSDLAQSFIELIFFFIVIPTAYIKFILKEKLSDFGLSLGYPLKGFFFSITSLLISSLLVYLFFNYTSFKRYYVISDVFSQNFSDFLVYELLLVAPFVIFYEFFFRGFVLFSFKKRLGRISPIFQFLIFVLFLLASQDFTWRNSLYIISAFFSGIISYKSRSFLYAMAYSFIFIVLVDAILIKIVR